MRKLTMTLAILVGTLIGTGFVGKMQNEKLSKARALSDKHFELFKMMTQWVKIKQAGRNLSDYLEKDGYKKIAVYGMSYAGETLINELKNSSVTVSYGIDRNAASLYSDIDIMSINDDLEDVDAIIVTAITFFDEIEKELSEKIDCPIISLRNILNTII
ncbi:MAG: hypothetical protein HFH75_02230 [Lachnospiraceae bacterium]|nr:hypothetical protein [Lachnospiraceae bacterium]